MQGTKKNFVKLQSSHRTADESTQTTYLNIKGVLGELLYHKVT